jgi:ATP-binding protein involved in chromosome partitioning
MISQAVAQLLRDVDGGELDYLLIDLPPGTGDVQLTLAQVLNLTGVVIVSTPQHVALGIAAKAHAMFKQLHVPILGVVENMSYFVCGNCRHQSDIFGRGGGEAMAAELGVPFMGSIPIYQPIREGSDNGVPLMISEPDSPASQAFMSAAERVAAQVSIASFNRPATIPLTVVR